MELPDGSEKAASARAALLKELAPERADAPDYVFGAPRLERFLQGNGGSLEDAAVHYRKMLKWRKEVDMAERRKAIEGKPWCPDSVPGLRSLVESLRWDIECYDRTGSLLWVQCDGIARLDTLMDLSDEELFDTIYLMCELRQGHLDKLSEKEGRLVKAVHIRDLSGLSITGLLRDRAIMGRLKAVMGFVNVAYPESVEKLVLLNLPAGFNLLWAALQPLMNDRIKKKFCFLSKDNYLAELVDVVGSSGLEALVRARQRAMESPSIPFEVQPGFSEYACHRASSTGQMVSWSFSVGPRGSGGGLRFAVLFATEAGEKEVLREVRPASTVSIGAEQGSFVTEAPGLVFLVFTNAGSWARSKRVEGLRLVVHDSSVAEDDDDEFGLAAGARRRSRRRRPRAAAPDDFCGCLAFTQLFGASPAGASTAGEADDDDPTPASSSEALVGFVRSASGGGGGARGRTGPFSSTADANTARTSPVKCFLVAGILSLIPTIVFLVVFLMAQRQITRAVGM